MQTTTSTQIFRIARVAALGIATAGAVLMTGCGGFAGTGVDAPITVAGVKMQGTVFGGQQPVVGSTIQLYAANQTGYGLGSYALLTGNVTTDSAGGFSITGAYTCSSASTPVYITATGGSAGSIGTNSGIAMMAALGACGNLTAGTFININELTTVASAYALSAFMSGPGQLSTSATNATGLTNAFATVNKLVNTSTGAMPGSTLPTGATEPTTELNTLANILAACVNSTGGSTPCSSLFNASTPAAGTAPADTLTAILNIAKNPARNVTTLYNLAGPTAPFQPSLTSAPTDFTVALKYAPVATFSTPSAAAVASTGDLWVTNSGNNTVTILNATSGGATFTSGGSLSGPSGIAFDQSGNAYVTNKTSSRLSAFTPAGVGSLDFCTLFSAPTAIAIDGAGLLWIANSGSNTVAYDYPNNSCGVPSAASASAGVSAPVAIAINPR